MHWQHYVILIFLAGIVLRLLWLLGGLWQIRRFRIRATPLYPVPETVRAACALTHADAVFCISRDVPGPVMFGSSAPVVLLPELFLRLNEEAQCSVACHEALHVKRHDWLITVAEEVAGALFWPNPAVWWLLAQARLAREQLVDEEVVRLTSSREPYIDALLTIARARPSLDLAPAPLFLRRRHLTQRMYSLLKEVHMSRFRLASSYLCVFIGLAGTTWGAFLFRPLTGRPQVRVIAADSGLSATSFSVPAGQQLQQAPGAVARPYTEVSVAPVPSDPHELVTGSAKEPETPDQRAAILSLLERTQQNSDMHMPGTPPFVLAATFNSGGDVSFTGPGELTETWLSGKSWRWTASLGRYSQVRVSSFGQTVDEKPVSAVPMRVQMLRGAIFWPIKGVFPASRFRFVRTQWQGRKVTCMLLSGQASEPTPGGRRWTDREYCVDDSSGLLLIYSEAPGSYAVYSYGKNQYFHGRTMPDQIAFYVNGNQVIDARIAIADAGSVDNQLLTVTQEMAANGRAIILSPAARFYVRAPLASASATDQPAIVHAPIDPQGHVVEEELSAAADGSMGQLALDLVRQRQFSAAGFNQREAYITVDFTAQR